MISDVWFLNLILVLVLTFLASVLPILKLCLLHKKHLRAFAFTVQKSECVNHKYQHISFVLIKSSTVVIHNPIIRQTILYERFNISDERSPRIQKFRSR